jgi:cytochrome c biogenesis protein CcmG, thiol:disulfide interchange protein DsbE
MKHLMTITTLFLAIVMGAFFIGRSSNKPRNENPVKSSVSAEKVAEANRGTEPGNLAPEFQLTQLDGTALTLSDLRGQPAVLVFWASWCSFCKEEAPHVNKLAEAFANRGVHVFGINVRDSQARTEWGIKNFGIHYPVVRDANGNAARDYNVEGIPNVLFLDRKGVVRYVGSHIPGDYAERLERMLAESN